MRGTSRRYIPTGQHQMTDIVGVHQPCGLFDSRVSRSLSGVRGRTLVNSLSLNNGQSQLSDVTTTRAAFLPTGNRGRQLGEGEPIVVDAAEER